MTMDMTLDALPVEILESILSYVPCRDIWNSLLVSKRWHEVAEPLAYEALTICLTGAKAASVQYSLDHHQLAFVRKVKTLTVKVPLVPSDGHDPNATLQQLIIDQILPRANMLESFTLRTIDNCTGEEVGRGASKVALAGMLNQLLQIRSLTTLILDVDAAYQDYQFRSHDDQYHPCMLISRLMLQLEHIKIRMPCICPHLLAQYRAAAELCPPARPLKTFVVNGVFSRPGLPRRVSQHCAEQPFDRWGAVRETFPTWMGFARRVSESMPALERFWVITETQECGRFVAADRIKQDGWALPADDWTAKGVCLPPSAIRPWF